MTPDASKHNPDPKYLRELIEKAMVAQSEAAVLIGINERSMRRYLDGTYEIPYVVQFCMECLAADAQSRRPNKATLRRTKRKELEEMRARWEAEQAKYVSPAAGYKRAGEHLSAIYAELLRRSNGAGD